MTYMVKTLLWHKIFVKKMYFKILELSINYVYLHEII